MQVTKFITSLTRQAIRQNGSKQLFSTSVNRMLDEDDPVTKALLSELRVIGLTSEESEEILKQHPRLVSKEHVGKIQNCYWELMRIMPKASAQTVLTRSPRIVLRDTKELEQINSYVIEQMGIKTSDIARCGVFRYSLEHIRTRHLFLYRAGLYELPDHDGLTKDIQNPSLKKIVDTTERQFVEMSRLTRQEFNAFKNILYMESEAEDSDSEVDEDDDEFPVENFTHSEKCEQLYQKKNNKLEYRKRKFRKSIKFALVSAST